ncbi:hypothetical protein HDG34_001651 [Paraburkholderia sp. HC6.4b]|nr:hypothetical protein [Paraburkholderia sp. HC6.4b]MBB5452268.1 hypothetical protein [Paraburkholderia sp. Kb1A]
MLGNPFVVGAGLGSSVTVSRVSSAGPTWSACLTRLAATFERAIHFRDFAISAASRRISGQHRFCSGFLKHPVFEVSLLCGRPHKAEQVAGLTL